MNTTPNRYGRWATARRLINTIVNHLETGGVVVISGYYKGTQYDLRHAGMFKATRTGAYVQRGNQWDCIDYSSVKYYRQAEVTK